MSKQSHAIHPEASKIHSIEEDRPITTILMVVLASFIAGFIPIIYGSMLAQTTPDWSPTTPGEAGLWSSLLD